MIPPLKQLSDLFECIQDEAKQNEAFAKKLEKIFSEGPRNRERPKPRPTPVLDPFEAAKEGTLEAQLLPLSEQELKIIISKFGYRKSAQIKKATKEMLIEIIATETSRHLNHGKVFQRHTKK